MNLDLYGSPISRTGWYNVGANANNGGYRVTMASGVIAAGISAGNPVCSARWTHASKRFILQRLRATATILTGPTTAQEFGLAAYIARGFNVADSGQTAINMTGNVGKKRTANAGSQFGASGIRIASTGAITAGTRTLDAQSFAQTSIWQLAAAATTPNQSITLDAFYEDMPRAYPFVLAQNEGIVIANTVTTAVMTYRLFVDMEWMEVDQIEV